MQLHQERVVEEARELSDKLVKLTNFIDGSPIFQGLSSTERRLLLEQQFFMKGYFNVLKARIDAF